MGGHTTQHQRSIKNIMNAELHRTSGGGFFVLIFLRRVLYSAVPMASIFAGLAYS